MGAFSSAYAFIEVDSLQPTLRWEAFPRQKDLELDNNGILAALGDVTYDLRIWRADNNYPSELVYERRGLPESSHRMDAPLEPSTNYFWTIRARFELDGHPRVTQWGTYLMAQDHADVPNLFCYRFQTPKR